MTTKDGMTMMMTALKGAMMAASGTEGMKNVCVQMMSTGMAEGVYSAQVEDSSAFPVRSASVIETKNGMAEDVWKTPVAQVADSGIETEGNVYVQMMRSMTAGSVCSFLTAQEAELTTLTTGDVNAPGVNNGMEEDASKYLTAPVAGSGTLKEESVDAHPMKSGMAEDV